MKPFALIVYDFDGTLFDTRQDIAHAVNTTLTQLGLPKKKPEIIFTFIGDGVEVLMKRAIEGTNFSDTFFAVETFEQVYSKNLVKHTDFYPECRQTVENFLHKKQAIHSNKPERFVHNILYRFNFSRPFQAVVGGDTLKSRKPDPEGLFHILEKLKVSPDATLMVGDSSVDIEVGKRAGVTTCGVTYGIGGKDGVAGADHMIENIAELKELIY